MGESRNLLQLTQTMSSSSYRIAEAPADSNTCLWCSSPIDSEISVKDRVCRKCYNLLLNAGISEEEIFRQNKKESQVTDK